MIEAIELTQKSSNDIVFTSSDEDDEDTDDQSQERREYPFIIKKVQIGAGRPKKALHEQKKHQSKREELCNDKSKKYHLEKSNEAQLKKK